MHNHDTQVQPQQSKLEFQTPQQDFIFLLGRDNLFSFGCKKHWHANIKALMYTQLTTGRTQEQSLLPPKLRENVD